MNPQPVLERHRQFSLQFFIIFKNQTTKERFYILHEQLLRWTKFSRRQNYQIQAYQGLLSHQKNDCAFIMKNPWKELSIFAENKLYITHVNIMESLSNRLLQNYLIKITCLILKIFSSLAETITLVHIMSHESCLKAQTFWYSVISIYFPQLVDRSFISTLKTQLLFLMRPTTFLTT